MVHVKESDCLAEDVEEMHVFDNLKKFQPAIMHLGR